MRNLEQSITEWRQNMLATPGINCETVDELESHLRDVTEQLIATGLTETEAFQKAVENLGSTPAISSEFQKLDNALWWPIKLAVSIALVAAFAMGLYCFTSYNGQPLGVLLFTHIFFIFTGYFTTFLLGGMGICYVIQRNFAPFPAQKQRNISRASEVITAAMAWFTFVGVLLGAAWAKASWGRYWDWDPRETGALCVVIWHAIMLIAYRRLPTHVLMLMAIFGNIFVSIAWFARSGVVTAALEYGNWNRALPLLLLIALHLVIMLIALLPAGWLRFQKSLTTAND